LLGKEFLIWEIRSGSESAWIARRSRKLALEILLQLSGSQGKRHKNPCLLRLGVMKRP